MKNSNEFNLKIEKCLSCKHYSGCLGVDSGFSGNRIEYEEKGVCNQRDKNTTAKDWCSRWERDSRIAAEIAAIEKKKEEKRARDIEFYNREKIKRQEREIARERNKLERERYALELERKKLAHEKWLSSLTPEQREIEEEKETLVKEHLHHQLEDEKITQPFKQKLSKINGHLAKWKLIYILPVGIIFSVLFLFLMVIYWMSYFEQMEELLLPVLFSVLFLFLVVIGVILPIVLRIHWKREKAQIENKLEECKKKSSTNLFYEALCCTQTQNAVGVFIEKKHARNELIREEDGPMLIKEIKSYCDSRVGELIIGVEDMTCFLTLLLANEKITNEEFSSLLTILLHSDALTVTRQSKEMASQIEQMKETIKKEQLSLEECEKKMQSEKSVLQSYLLLRATCEISEDTQGIFH